MDSEGGLRKVSMTSVGRETMELISSSSLVAASKYNDADAITKSVSLNFVNMKMLWVKQLLVFLYLFRKSLFVGVHQNQPYATESLVGRSKEIEVNTYHVYIYVYMCICVCLYVMCVCMYVCMAFIKWWCSGGYTELM